MEFPLHPAAASAIDDKGSALLGEIVALNLPDQRVSASFPSERITVEIKENEIIGDVDAWLMDASGRRVFAFISHNKMSYGLMGESCSLVGEVIKEVIKVKWAQQFLGQSFIEQTIIGWLRASFKGNTVDALSQFLISASRTAVREFTMWAPVSHLEIESPFSFGLATIAPMTSAFFDEVEMPSVANCPKQAEDIRALFSQIRKDMQGGAAIVLKVKAEQSSVYERGLALASDAIGLLRYLSPASDIFSLICPNSLLGAQTLPTYNAIVLDREGGFSNQSGVIPKKIGFWRISAREAVNLRSHGLTELGRLLLEKGLNEFQRRLRACILTYTKGITLPEPADRLVYTCSSLESLLLRDTSEPIQQNLGDRMAFLLTTIPSERSRIAGNVRQAYSIRSKYIHHRNTEIEEDTLSLFTINACATFRMALQRMNDTNTSAEFIEAIDRVKFGW